MWLEWVPRKYNMNKWITTWLLCGGTGWLFFSVLTYSALIISLHFKLKNGLLFQPFFNTLLKLWFSNTFKIFENKIVESLSRIKKLVLSIFTLEFGHIT